MRRILASTAAIALMAGTASTAFAKDHLQPAASADEFGQPRADESYEVGGEIAKIAAKAGTQDGSVQSAAAKTVAASREPAMPKVEKAPR
jgi:hypothetical protein